MYTFFPPVGLHARKLIYSFQTPKSTPHSAIFMTKAAETAQTIKKKSRADVNGEWTFLFLGSKGHDCGEPKQSVTPKEPGPLKR